MAFIKFNRNIYKELIQKNKYMNKYINKIKNAYKDADEVYLCGDNDAVGESISNDIMDILLKSKKKEPIIKRIVFNEITEEAIQNAVKNYRNIDYNIVNSEKCRAISDKLCGYSLSPLL